MTREETKQLFKKIMTAYPSFKPVDLKESVDLWSKALENDSFEDVMERFDNYVRVNKFAPTIADLRTVKKNQNWNFNQRNYSKEFWKEIDG